MCNVFGYVFLLFLLFSIHFQVSIEHEVVQKNGRNFAVNSAHFIMEIFAWIQFISGFMSADSYPKCLFFGLCARVWACVVVFFMQFIVFALNVPHFTTCTNFAYICFSLHSHKAKKSVFNDSICFPVLCVCVAGTQMDWIGKAPRFIIINFYR